MKATYLYPGQGSQIVGMGKDFYENNAIAKEMFEEASDRLKIDFKKLLFEENENLNQTQFSQPAILLVSAIANKLYSKKISPIFGLGHSLGEFSALVGNEALNFSDGIFLVYNRGLLMQKACENQDAGMMAVIGLEYENLNSLCNDFQKEGKSIYLANINNPTQIVLAGKKQDLKSVEDVLKQNGAKRALLLPMSVASHCPLLDTAINPFGEFLETYLKDSFSYPIISNVTAKTYDSKNEGRELLKKQLISPVKYTQCMETAEQSDCFIEFGGKVLSGLNKRITKKPTYSITDMKSLEQIENL